MLIDFANKKKTLFNELYLILLSILLLVKVLDRIFLPSWILQPMLPYTMVEGNKSTVISLLNPILSCFNHLLWSSYNGVLDSFVMR